MGTLLDRKDTIVTEEEDQTEEGNNIKQALNQCGYHQWPIDKVESNKAKSKQLKKSNRDEKDKTNGLVVIPYIEGLTERLSRTFKKYDFSTP